MSAKGKRSVAALEAMIATQPGIERKGKATPYSALNGHMFSFVTKEGGLALRLSKEQRETFLKKHKAAIVEQHGAVMKEYVLVPPALLARKSELAKYFDASVAYIASLKPKPTTRRRTPKHA